MKITAVRMRVARLTNRTLDTSYGPGQLEREHLFVQVETDADVVGFGEGSPLPHFSGERASEMVRVAKDVFAPAVLGADVHAVEAIEARLGRALPHHYATKAAFISALYDLRGKLVGLPVSSLLGGPIRTSIPVAGAIGAGAVEDVVKEAESLVASGVRTLKLKVGADLARDLAVLREVRRLAGPEVAIRADANQGYAFPDALRFFRETADLDLQYVEQPLAAGDLGRLAELRGRSLTPVAVDESLFGLRDAMEVVRQGVADVFIVKLIKLGGIHRACKVAALAEAAGIPCVAVSPYETSLGVSANVHLAASAPAFPWASELGVSDVPNDPWRGLHYDGRGAVHVPTAPGLGVEPAEALFDAESVVVV